MPGVGLRSVAQTVATLALEVAARSEAGVRPSNQDAVGSHVPSDPELLARKGALLVLADGVGGHRAGDVAADLAVHTVIDDYYAPGANARIEPALRHAVQSANLVVHQSALNDEALRGMETTLVAAVVAGAYAYIAHAGDSRLYHWHGESLRQLTSDHSEVAELIRMRVLSRDRARDHPRRSALTRTVGGQLILRPDFVRVSVAAGDRLLLCTDGLWAAVDDEQLAAHVAKGDAAAACDALVSAALAAGSDDNVSAIVTHVHGAPQARPEPSGWGWLPIPRVGRPPQ